MSENISGTKAAHNIVDLKGKAVIFDMDGTLVDNTPFHYRAWVDLFKKHNLPHLERETYLAEISGVPIANTVSKYFGNDRDKAFITALVEEKQHLYQLAFKPHLKPVPGLISFLANLKKAGLKIALATSSSIDDVDFIFDGIPMRQYFDELVTGNMVSQPKPSPQIFLKAAELLKASPDDCICI
ncbi:HAD family phosphatase [Mucilaginibacter pallidiroseus]|uniref:HAD family phosphatase n=1 Tax=Mucilaginibacter pallidiroseus TaxID=2599295 RepID=A0A563U7R8_9SPHI|nr:HAD family phosphatase [Mucilaginibacter pallidiroseus]TWR27397.1 HAD family phosphatase [Mucilaginibacter pallidiroseus]